MPAWYLECIFDDDKPAHRYFINRFPFTIGREKDLSITIPRGSISRRHSRIDLVEDRLWIVDLNSHNGTFVNHQRIHEATPIQHGDILHIGNVEMRLIRSDSEEDDDTDEGTLTIDAGLSEHFPSGVRELEELLTKAMISPAYQPIVGPCGHPVVGYELLGRGASSALPSYPKALFTIAESVGLEVKLSELMREKGIETAAKHGMRQRLFVNTHPRELKDMDGLLSSLHGMKTRFPSLPLAVEIHEQAITDLDSIRLMKNEMQGMDIELAFDDFGVGQSRLIELAEATPDIIKFDISLIHEIDRAEPTKIHLVHQLHQLSKSLEIKTLAECVHQQQEYEACRDIGFDYFQGFLFGKPSPLDPMRL